MDKGGHCSTAAGSSRSVDESQPQGRWLGWEGDDDGDAVVVNRTCTHESVRYVTEYNSAIKHTAT